MEVIEGDGFKLVVSNRTDAHHFVSLKEAAYSGGRSVMIGDLHCLILQLQRLRFIAYPSQ
jgi:predicted nicotinamide N-methyase